MKHHKPLFDLGKTIITKDGMAYILQHEVEITEILKEHQKGDWSHMSKWYQNANKEAAKTNGYIRGRRRKRKLKYVKGFWAASPSGESASRRALFA